MDITLHYLLAYGNFTNKTNTITTTTYIYTITTTTTTTTTTIYTTILLYYYTNFNGHFTGFLEKK